MHRTFSWRPLSTNVLRLQRVNPIRKEIAEQGGNRVLRATGFQEQAFRIASDNFLNGHRRRRLPTDLRSEGMYQYIMALQEVALRGYHKDLLRSDGVAFEDVQIVPLKMMGWLDEASQPSEEVAFAELEDDSVSGISLIQSLQSDPNLTILSANVSPTPVKILLEQLASACQIRFQFSSQANAMVVGNSRSLHLSGKSLATILDAILLPSQLAWIHDPDSNPNIVRVVALEELGGPDEANLDAQQRFWMEATARAIRQFQLQYTNDSRVGALQLAEGNLAVIRGDYETAGNIFEVLREKRPREELLAKVMFNKAKMNVLLNRSEIAIENMDTAAYQTVNNELRVAGFWLIGQLFLELSQFDEAIKFSHIALESAETDAQKQVAAITLAKAYVFNNDALNANRVLSEQEDAFKDSKLKKIATVINHFSQFIGLEDNRRKQIAEERLLFALADTKLKDAPTALDRYLVGRAYQELGFSREAIEFLEAASKSPTETSSTNQILYALAIEKINLSQFKDAQEILSDLLKRDQGMLGRRSGLRLSRLYLDAKKYEVCIELGKNLLERDLSSPEQKATLRIMGHAYRGLDKHKSAALCFAGLHPGVKNRQKPIEDERWQ